MKRMSLSKFTLKQHPTSMENLPCDVLLEIFIRLFAKQVSQMRCVCKSWNAIISESSFIKSHLHHSIRNNDVILLFFRDGFWHCSLIEARLTRYPDLDMPSLIAVPENPQPLKGYNNGRIIGSVNGLVCLSYRSYSVRPLHYVVLIWNPSLSRVLTLPSCPPLSFESMWYHFRFGFDPKTENYKVIRLTSQYGPCNMLPQVEVYSMRKGSWKLITQEFPSHIKMIADDDHVCVDGHDGHLHWLGSTGLKWKPETILTFDLGAETFSEIPLPDSILHRHEYCKDVLGVLGGKLCVMTKDRNDEYEVWVMDEYGVADLWVKHQVFLPYSGEFTSHNELIFDVDDHFYLYDPVAAQTKPFDMWGTLRTCKIVEYVDSLVWVAPAKHELSIWHPFIYIFNSPRLLIKKLRKETKGISQFLFRRGI